ncbi:MAG: ABC transporter permease [Bacillota bacterium]
MRSIYIQVTDMDLMDRVMAQLEIQLTEKFRGDTNSYRIFKQEDAMETLNSVNETMNTMLIGVAAISLVVGGIGIMNIMLVSVTERTRKLAFGSLLARSAATFCFSFWSRPLRQAV